MIEDFLIRLCALAESNIISSTDYTTIYDIMMEAKKRQNLPTFEALAEKLSKQYEGKLLYEDIGSYHSFGYPKFEAHPDSIGVYLKPYYCYFNDSKSVESRFKNYKYMNLWENECDTRIKPMTLEEMEDMLKTFEGVNVEYVINKFKR